MADISRLINIMPYFQENSTRPAGGDNARPRVMTTKKYLKDRTLKQSGLSALQK